MPAAKAHLVEPLDGLGHREARHSGAVTQKDVEASAGGRAVVKSTFALGCTAAHTRAGGLRMAVDEKAVQFAIKDVVVAVPLVASALAITWEIGFFVRIRGGAFGFFSVAEHLNFALEALPVALMITVIGAIALVRDHLVALLPTTSEYFTRVKDRILKTGGLSLLVSMVLPTLIILWYSGFDPMLLVLIFATAAPYVWVRYLPVELTRNLLIQCMVVVGVFLCALLTGFAMARSQIKSSLPLNIIKIGEKSKEAETDLKVRILRTGERGVLYFDPGTQAFALIPWELVKRIDWSISPLFKR